MRATAQVIFRVTKGSPRMELDLAVELARGGPVEADLLLHAQDADRLKPPERTERV